MKTIYTLRNLSATFLIWTLLFSPVFAQARYKHLPRIKIEKQTQGKAVVEQHNFTPVILAEENPIEQPSAPTIITKEDPVAKTDILTTTLNKHDRVVSIKLEPQKQNRKSFSERIKTKNYLRGVKEVKEVKKTMLIGYLLWFLMVLLLGVALFVLAFIFLGIIVYTAYYIFLIFGIVGLTIALLILIFGLTNIIA